jgi:hypothetical protein
MFDLKIPKRIISRQISKNEIILKFSLLKMRRIVTVIKIIMAVSNAELNSN